MEKYNWEQFKEKGISYAYDTDILSELKEDLFLKIIKVEDTLFVIRNWDSEHDYKAIIDFYYTNEELNTEEKYTIEKVKDVVEELEEMGSLF